MLSAAPLCATTPINRCVLCYACNRVKLTYDATCYRSGSVGGQSYVDTHLPNHNTIHCCLFIFYMQVDFKLGLCNFMQGACKLHTSERKSHTSTNCACKLAGIRA